VMTTDLRTAEMIKYASNAFLATRISFINEIAGICDRLGADVKQVAQGMGLDKRIGPYFLDAGVGYGGSCFPKDVKALEYMASIHGSHPQLLRAVMETNRVQRRSVLQKVREGWARSTIALSRARPGSSQLRRHAEAPGGDHPPAALDGARFRPTNRSLPAAATALGT